MIFVSFVLFWIEQSYKGWKERQESEFQQEQSLRCSVLLEPLLVSAGLNLTNEQLQKS